LVTEITGTYSRRGIADRIVVCDLCFVSDGIDRGDGKTLGADGAGVERASVPTVPAQEVTPDPASEQE